MFIHLHKLIMKTPLCDQITNAQALNLAMFFYDKFHLYKGQVKLTFFAKPSEFSLAKDCLITP